MIPNNNKTSLLIPSQLPEFIRGDPSYQNFILFLQAYYEWMEQSGKVTDVSKNLTNYWDIDNTTDQFLEYLYNDFLPYFPKEILADKQKVTKIAKELYKTKGTPASYQFLFRVLYNSDVDFFYTKDAVLRASAGKWYVAISLKLASSNNNFLNTNNLRLFGETTKSIATIENSVLAGTKIEVFISNIQRLFQSGEFVRVVDSNNQDVLFGGQPLRAKVVGQISQIKIDPNNRGNFYQPNDPVIVFNGLNSANGLGASAKVGTTTAGAIQRITVNSGGFGYAVINANTKTTINITNGGGALAVPGSFNPAANSIANVAFIPNDYITLKRFHYIGNIATSSGANTYNSATGLWTQQKYQFANNSTANANTSLANAFTFLAFSTFPISSVIVQNGGGGISTPPSVTASSLYESDVDAAYGDLKNLGILAPIQIVSGGKGYVANDVINFIGGIGNGARANVLTVNATGSITSVGYVYKNGEYPIRYPLGGLGYTSTALPALTVTSSNVLASNASLYVSNILGDGATFSAITDRVGTITTINIIDPGEDYVSTPNVSMKVQDIIVSNVSINNIVKTGDIVYQGTSYANSSYIAIVSSINQVYSFANVEQSLYNLRVFNYNSLPNYSLPINVSNNDINMIMSNQYPTLNVSATRYNSDGVITYGDGSAKANASFLNGLVISQGQYLDTTGQPSSFDVLQSTNFNNYTYQITLEKEIEKYRSTLLNLLHPTGMKVLGRFAMKSNNAMDFHVSDALDEGHTLGYYTGNPGSYAVMNTDFTTASTNIVRFFGLSGANLENFITTNNTVLLADSYGEQIHSEVISISKNILISDYISVQDSTATPNVVWYARNSTNAGNNLGWIFTSDAELEDVYNTITLKDNVWLAFANVATITANSGSNTINIRTITNSYNIINNGIFTNPAYPILDIVHAGDLILIANNAQKTVQSVNHLNNTIVLTTNLSSNANSFLSVNRTISTTNVKIFGPTGTRYYPTLITQSGESITTELDEEILLG